jgi:hypothetical protein
MFNNVQTAISETRDVFKVSNYATANYAMFQIILKDTANVAKMLRCQNER